MLLKSREIAVTGILMAIGVILILLGGYFEGSTLFFLAAASFLTGMIQRNISFPAAAAYLAGTVLLGFVLAPQKLYCFTFMAFSIYVICAEGMAGNAKKQGRFKKRSLLWAGKAIIFHILLLIVLFAGKELFGLAILFQGKLLKLWQSMSVPFWIGILVCAEVFWLVFDKAYFYVQDRYGSLLARLLRE